MANQPSQASVERIRVAALQYLIRPVKSFAEFSAQVDGLIDTAMDYGCHLLVFPEYFTLQLLTLGDVKRPMRDQIRDLASQRDRVVELVSAGARRSGMYIIGGTIPMHDAATGRTRNVCHVCAPSGEVGSQAKLRATRFEDEEWGISGGERLRVFDTAFGRLAVAICYDVEFPEIARAASKLHAHILAVPSCTDDRHGYQRVRYCAHARAIENQSYVIHACTVGSLPMVPAVSLNYGQAAILTPNDFPFARDGILAEGNPNQEAMVIGELNLRTIDEARIDGTVLTLRDSGNVHDVAANPELLAL